jgi:hypothetical protein
MGENKNSILSAVILVSILLMLNSSKGMKNDDRPVPKKNKTAIL